MHAHIKRISLSSGSYREVDLVQSFAPQFISQFLSQIWPQLWLRCTVEAIAAYLALSKVDLGGKLQNGKNGCMHAWVGGSGQQGGKLWKAIARLTAIARWNWAQMHACMHGWTWATRWNWYVCMHGVVCKDRLRSRFRPEASYRNFYIDACVRIYVYTYVYAYVWMFNRRVIDELSMSYQWVMSYI